MDYKQLFLSAATVGVLFSAVPAHAEPFVMNGTTYQVDDIAGSGANESLLEIDFGTNAAPQAFLFGFQWDGTTSVTGRDVLAALQSNNHGLTFTDTFFPDFDEHLLNTLQYKTFQPPDDYPNDFWNYFSSSDGQTWTSPDLGYDGIALTNGSYFGWALQNDDPNEFVFSPPFFPPSHAPAAIVGASAPEPATLGLAGLGVLGFCLRRRR